MVDQSTGSTDPSAQAGGGSAKEKASAAAQTAADSGSQVAQTAAQHTSEVAQTAADQAKNVVAEAGQQARDLLGEARGQLSQQAQGQHQNAVSSLRALGDELHTMVRNTRDSGQAGVGTEVVRQAADRAHGVADWLSQREPGDLFGELRTFAQRRPGAFLLGAAVAGVLAGRLTRGVTAAAHSDSGQASSTPAHARPADVTQAIDTPVEPMGSELPPTEFGDPGGSPVVDSPFAGGGTGYSGGAAYGDTEYTGGAGYGGGAGTGATGGFGDSGGYTGGVGTGATGGFGDSGEYTGGDDMPRTPGERPLPGGPGASGNPFPNEAR